MVHELLNPKNRQTQQQIEYWVRLRRCSVVEALNYGVKVTSHISVHI